MDAASQETLRPRDYPALLKEIPDPPKRLWHVGDLAAAHAPAVAIVGSRRCSRYGRDMAFGLAEQVAGRGVTVVSGLAYGVDAAAHRGALAAGGRTVAVMAGGLDRIYPAAHASLAQQIVAARGALVTEYAPDVTPRKHHFPARNRLVSGLCLGVVVVEAASRSGSLITARMALEQNREVMAVPGMATSALSKGCHRLIRDGAALIETIEDIAGAIGLAWPEEAPEAAVEPDDPVLAAVGAETTSADAIVADTGLAVDVVLSRLVELEVAGFVTASGGGYSRRPS
ncbi:MAG: DNA-protecting protein DprA [Gammaproteobacteria bacterium]|nr:DNA-processing protein DprA [Gammaproteobacteria bacterium]MXY52205.1 DNA-protecting protein DprA [Gammaproteobacteria bacterium]MYB37860.1 DNA-protecting protein DprA [Gammaproteobacteria bacterium]